MKKLYELEIMEEAISWVKFNKKVVIATVINTLYNYKIIDIFAQNI